MHQCTSEHKVCQPQIIDSKGLLRARASLKRGTRGSPPHSGRPRMVRASGKSGSGVATGGGMPIPVRPDAQTPLERYALSSSSAVHRANTRSLPTSPVVIQDVLSGLEVCSEERRYDTCDFGGSGRIRVAWVRRHVWTISRALQASPPLSQVPKGVGVLVCSRLNSRMCRTRRHMFSRPWLFQTASRPNVRQPLRRILRIRAIQRRQALDARDPSSRGSVQMALLPQVTHLDRPARRSRVESLSPTSEPVRTSPAMPDQPRLERWSS